MPQQKWTINDGETLKKIGKGFLISLIGAALTYLSTNLDIIINAITANPQLAILLTALFTGLFNAGREWKKGE